MPEEQGDEDGLLAGAMEGEGDRKSVNAADVKKRLREIGPNPAPEDAAEREVLEAYAALLARHAGAKSRLRAAQKDLDGKLDARYSELTESQIKQLVLEDKWLSNLAAAIESELDRVSQALTGRIRQLTDRYARPLAELVQQAETFAARVEQHLRDMGATWA